MIFLDQTKDQLDAIVKEFKLNWHKSNKLRIQRYRGRGTLDAFIRNNRLRVIINEPKVSKEDDKRLLISSQIEDHVAKFWKIPSMTLEEQLQSKESYLEDLDKMQTWLDEEFRRVELEISAIKHYDL